MTSSRQPPPRTSCATRDSNAADLDQFALNPPGRHQGLPLGGDEAADAKAEGGDRARSPARRSARPSAPSPGCAATPLVGPIAVAGGAAAGAYAGSLAGAVETDGRRPAGAANCGPPGVMVAVKADSAEDQEIAIDLLRDRGAQMIERADGVWRDGKWADFDPVRPPDIIESHVANDARHTQGSSP